MTILKEFHKEFPKNFQRIPKEFPKNSQKITKKNPKKFPKHSQDFENIQFPTSHLEAENPFGLVFLSISTKYVLTLIANNREYVRCTYYINTFNPSLRNHDKTLKNVRVLLHS